MIHNAIHTFDNDVKVYVKHLRQVQVDRYMEVNLHEPVEEEHFTNIIKAIDNSEAIFIDIGAAIGYYAILAKHLRPDIIVHAFEPLDLHRQYFQENIALNSIDTTNIRIHQEAISDRLAQADFSDRGYGSGLVTPKKSSRFHQLKRTIKNIIKPSQTSNKKKHYEKVQTITLDSFVKTLSNAVYLVKIDVQGAELKVLKGAQEAIKSKAIQHWIIGTHSEQIHEHCIQFFQENGYNISYENQQPQYQPDGIVIAQYL